MSDQVINSETEKRLAEELPQIKKALGKIFLDHPDYLAIGWTVVFARYMANGTSPAADEVLIQVFKDSIKCVREIQRETPAEVEA